MRFELKVPEVGESITEVEIGGWLKNEGDIVKKDDPVVTLESEKATVELPAPDNGTLTQVLKQRGEVAKVGEIIAYLEKRGEPAAAKAAEERRPDLKEQSKPPQKPVEARVMPAAQSLLEEHHLRPEEVQATGPGGRLLKEDVLRHVEQARQAPSAPPIPVTAISAEQPSSSPSREEEIVPMSRLRRTVAERLVQAQHNAALL